MNARDVPLFPPMESYPRLSQSQPIYEPAVVRVEPCVCGGYVRQYQGQADHAAVAVHYATEEHREWRLIPENEKRWMWGDR